MEEKRSFPTDWSNLDDKQVSDNINYLIDHYKEYEINRIDKNTISIEGVRLTKGKFQGTDTFCVKGKFYQDDQHSYYTMYDKINQLFDICDKEIAIRNVLKKLDEKRTRKTYRRAWWINKGPAVVSASVLVIIMGVLIGFAVNDYKKDEQLDEKVKQYEKTLPNYKEYEQTKQKIANYRDSLAHATR